MLIKNIHLHPVNGAAYSQGACGFRCFAVINTAPHRRFGRAVFVEQLNLRQFALMFVSQFARTRFPGNYDGLKRSQ